MKTLYEIYKSLLKEEKEVIEFPSDEFSAVADKQSAKVLFTSEKGKEMAGVLNASFLVLKIQDLPNKMIEVSFDPREDFNAVIEFLKSQAVREQG